MAATAEPKGAITEQTTPQFRADLARLDEEARQGVEAALRQNYELLRNDRRKFLANTKRPHPIRLKGGFTSSLYSLRAGRDIRLIMAVDDDPLFGQTLVTLFRAVPQMDLNRAYQSIANLIYRNQVERNGGAR